MKSTKDFLSIDKIGRRGVEMFYLYKKDDDTLEISNETLCEPIEDPEETEDMESIEIIVATKDAQDIAAYLKDYYDYTDEEVIEYLSSFDIILWRYK